MLIKVVEKFVMKPEFWDIPVSDSGRLNLFSAYMLNMVNDDFFCRKNYAIYEDPKNQTIYLSGVLGHSNALNDAKADQKIGKYMSGICSATVSACTIDSFDVCPDYHYCEHKEWKTLLLVSDHISGVPSFLCADCGGLVAKYRLMISKEVNIKLWDWERQHDAIDDLSVMCSDYELWADNELNCVKSKLNESGLSLVNKLSDELGCFVYYVFDSGKNILENCPQCEKSLTPSSLRKYSRECRRCRIILFQK